MKRTLRMLSLLLVLMLSFPLCAQAEENAENDWYLEKAGALRDELYELVSFDGYAEYFTGAEEVIALVDSWSAAMEAEPESVSCYDLPSLSLLMGLLPEESAIPPVMLKRLERGMAASLISQINAARGSSFLAASSIPTLSEGYIKPEGFAPCMVIYEYEGVCLSVSFTPIGEDVVSATAQFAAPEITSQLTPR